MVPESMISQVRPAATPPPGAEEVARADRLVALLGDIAEEYAEGGEMSPEAALAAGELVHEARALAATLARLPGLADRVDRVGRGIRALDPPFEIQDACRAMIDDILRAAPARREPLRAPDLERGRQVYAVACAGCHGAEGRPRPEVAAQMAAPPPDLLDSGTMNGLSPRRVFDVVTYGMRGTPMPEFPTLDERDRWSVAFYTMSLGRGPCPRPSPAVAIEELVWSDDNALVARHGEEGASCLRAAPFSGPRSARLAARRRAP